MLKTVAAEGDREDLTAPAAGRVEGRVNLCVAVVEDNARYRQSLETLFAHAPDFSLARGYESAHALVEEAERLARTGEGLPCGLVLMDLDLPGLSGIEATRRIKRAQPSVSVVILTVFEEPTTILEAISAGADGYLLKKTPAGELLAQLRAIAAGGAPLTAAVASTVLKLLRATGASAAQQSARPARLDLTDREQEVLRCLVRGLSYKQVADQLDISLDTVRSHVRAVYKKLQVHSVAEAVARAIREKLV